MQNALRCTLMFAVALAWVVVGSQNAAAIHITTWTGLFDDDWHNDLNWTNGSPDLDQRAVINNKVTVVIDDSQAAIADSIEIDPGAKLIILDGATLELTNCDDAGTCSPDPGQEHPDSLIKGDVQLEKGAELTISWNLTVQGDGGKITGLSTGGTAAGIITGTAGKILTIDNGGADPTLRADSLLVHGFLNVKVELVNNAFVVADNGILNLSNSDKSGDSGYWVAENDEYLLVNATVTGTSEWLLIDDKSAVIKFNQANTSLGGLFRIEKGTLDVDQNIETSGGLDFKSVGAFHPQIDVASGKTAEFFGP